MESLRKTLKIAASLNHDEIGTTSHIKTGKRASSAINALLRFFPHRIKNSDEQVSAHDLLSD